MSGDLNNKPPRSFYIIGGAALVWNLIGVMQYVMRVSMSEAAVAGLPANQQAFLQDIPGWATAAFAVATNAAAFGAGGVVLTILIIAIGAYLIWYSNGAKDKGWIS